MSKQVFSGIKLFGTDGIRALVNEENMGPEMGVKMGMAIISFCRKRNLPEKIVIGRDTRESGQMLEDAVSSGILSMGGDVVISGIITTPGLAFLVGDQSAGAGIVISASHNPYGHNGLKLFKNDGTKMTDEEEMEMEQYLSVMPERKKGDEFISGKKIILDGATDRYIKSLMEKMPKEAGEGKVKIILDCSNGAAFTAAPAVFKRISKDTECLFTEPDGKNINKGCGSQYAETLKNEVLKKGADLGLAFDGDGDRMIAIDEKGNELTGDHIIYTIAKMLKEKGELSNDAVVTTVMSNLGFVDSLKKIGIAHSFTPVGDRPVFFEMQKRGAVLGGEESGHIIISHFQNTGDGIAGGLMLLAAMNYFKKPLSELAGEVTLYPKILVNTEVKSKPDLDQIPDIREAINNAEDKLEGKGRVVVRYSGTENLARVMIEGRDKEEISVLADGIKDIIASKLN